MTGKTKPPRQPRPNQARPVAKFQPALIRRETDCVKTPTSGLRVESLSRLRQIRKEPLWQSPSKEEKRENNSAHSLLVHVFTQPGSKAALTAPKSNFRFTPKSGPRSDIAPCPKSARGLNRSRGRA